MMGPDLERPWKRTGIPLSRRRFALHSDTRRGVSAHEASLEDGTPAAAVIPLGRLG